LNVEANTEVIIVGGGAAGLSSLIWCNSLGLDAILLEGSNEFGGQMLEMYHPVIDYPGLLPRDGRELSDRFLEHIDRLNLRARCILDTRIEKITPLKPGVEITSATQVWRSRAVILALGARVRRLEVPGEREFESKGVSFSATRDHPQVIGKTAVVVGGGDSAVGNSLTLARVCKHVYLVHRGHHFRARPEWLNKAANNPQITLIPNSRVTSINGDSRVTEVEIEDIRTSARQSLPAEAVFVRIGMSPNSELVSSLVRLNPDGFIVTTENQETSVEMIYAAGDVCGPVSRSVATAVGHAAIATKHVARKLGRSARDLE
jgi:thioredoxin reductase (NADPH)